MKRKTYVKTLLDDNNIANRPFPAGLSRYLSVKDLWYLSMEDGEASLLDRSTDINARYDGAVFMISVLGIGWLDGE